MYKLILLIWNKEQLPTEWLQGIICPIHKKGERAICSNYRPITLLNIAYKIFTIILNNRLSKLAESKLSEAQAGFRSNKSTLENIFIIIYIIRQTFEKCYKYNIDLHKIFDNYQQVFDSIKRNKVIHSLNEYNIP
jgi:sorting nexin-29